MIGGLSSKKLAFLAIVFLVIAVAITVFASKQQTQTNQNASEAENINKNEGILNTNNSDGTMGPITSTGNFSNSLPDDRKGSLIFMVSDPMDNKNKPTLPNDISEVKSNINSQDKKPTVTKSVSNGPQTVTSLILTIKKVEVHLAYLVDKSGQKTVDHWETLNMPNPVSVDLVQLAKGGVSSLGITNLAAGKYTEVRLYVDKANAILTDGSNVNLTISGKDSIARVIQPFSINAKKNTTLVMDFDASKSVIANGNSQYILKPVVSKLLENQ